MKDLLVLASFEALVAEQRRLDKLENILKQEMHTRSLAFKHEERVNQMQLNGMLAKIDMLRCESTCLQAMLIGERVWAEDYRAWLVQAAQTARILAKQRETHNVWIAKEIERLGEEIKVLEHKPMPDFSLLHTDADKDAAVDRNYSQMSAIREQLAKFASHCETVLQRLDDSAQSGRDIHAEAMSNAAKVCNELRSKVISMRKELRALYSNEMVVWAESVGKIARTKARWDMMFPVCPLDLVVFEAFRQRRMDLN